MNVRLGTEAPYNSFLSSLMCTRFFLILEITAIDNVGF